MNVIYRVHGAGGFYMETQSQDQAFRAARQEAAASGQKGVAYDCINFILGFLQLPRAA